MTESLSIVQVTGPQGSVGPAGPQGVPGFSHLPYVTEASASGDVTADLSESSAWLLILTGDVTLAFTGATGGAASQLVLFLRQDATGGHSVTWPSGITWPGGSPPALGTAAGATSIVELWTLDGGTTWYGSEPGAGGGGSSGVQPISGGGTGQTSQQAAINALTGTQGAGEYLRSDGTNASLQPIQAADVPQLSQYNPAGLAGATAPTSYAGGTVSGHPLSGTWAKGQWVVDQAGHIYVCVAGGTPGTWRRAGSDPWQFFLDDYCAGDGQLALITVTSGSAVINTTPLAAPAAPALTPAPTGGTLAAGTYRVIATLVNRWGETVGSASAGVTTTGSTSVITVASPAVTTATGNATGWYAYVTAAGGSTYFRQQAAGSPMPLGAAFVLTAAPATAGANPPVSDTSAAQVFDSSRDPGKHIMINGALLSSPSTPWLDTIASVQSPTQATLSTANAAVNQSGCAAFWCTDDQANVNACIADARAYALANNYLCQVIAGARPYGLASPPLQQTAASAGTYYNTQVPVPVPQPSGAARKLDFQLLGPASAAYPDFWESTYPNLAACSFVSFLLAPGTPDPVYGQQSVIGGPSNSTGQLGSFANTKVTARGWSVVMPSCTNLIGLDLAWAGGCHVEEWSARAFAPAVAGVNPMINYPNDGFFSGRAGIGLRLPVIGNNDDVYVPSASFEGITKSIYADDHATIGRLATIYSQIGLVIENRGLASNGHDVTVSQWSCEGCGGGLYFTGGTCVVDITYDAEAMLNYDVQEDSGGGLSGIFRYSDVSGRNPVINTAPNLEVINGMQSRVVKTAPAYTLGTAFQNPWWRHMWVTLNAGTTTGILIGPTSAACTTSAGTTTASPVTFRLPSGWWLNIQGTVKPATFNAIPD